MIDMQGMSGRIQAQNRVQPLSCLILQMSICILNSFQKGLYYWKHSKHLAEMGVMEILEMTSQCLID